MPQAEKEDERFACEVVSSEIGESFEFADLNGDVDYRSQDGTHVLEVTRFTNSAVRRDMAEAENRETALQLGTGYDWAVVFDGHPKYDGLAARLYKPLLDLETHGLDRYDVGSMHWWLQSVPTLATSMADLKAERVTYAAIFSTRELPTRMFIATTAGYTYSGPDAALTILEEAVHRDVKHIEKLGRQSAGRRHLWYWTDGGTVWDFRRALDAKETRLPSRPPAFPCAVTDLWCVDEGGGRGWRWDSDAGWSWVTVARTGFPPPPF